jgi:hypothetical protein
VLARYPHIRRLIVVADRGLLSLDNIEELGKLKLPGAQPQEFILAVPGQFTPILEGFQAKAAATAEAEIVEEARWQGLRLVVAHNPDQASAQTAQRRERIAALQARADQLAGKLDVQDTGEVKRGRKLSDSGAKARFFHEVSEAHLARIVKVDLKSDLFAYDIDTVAQQRAELMDCWRRPKTEHGSDLVRRRQAPGPADAQMAEVTTVDLCLLAGQRAQAQVGLGRRARARARAHAGDEESEV